MRVGLGTGTTVAYLIEAIAERRACLAGAAFFAASKATRSAAWNRGIATGNMAFFDRLDLTIDGADELDGRLFAVKGGGGALLREKVLAAAADRMVVIADGSKRVERIGAAKVPVEVLPFARSFVDAKLMALGARTTLRMGEAHPTRTDNANAIIDCTFEAIPDPVALARAIEAIPGALGHGLFLTEVDAAYVADKGIVTRLERSAAAR